MKSKWLLVAGLLLPAIGSQAEEGMWTLDNLPSQDLKASYGFEPDADWLRHAQRSAVRLAGGCSGSFVSPQGLVLTNYHCVIGCVQQLTSAERDLLKDGFVAGNHEQELRCPTFELNRLEEVTDVTERIKAATAGRDGNAFAEAKRAVQAEIEKACVGGEGETRRCDVVELYHGGIYQLYRYHRFNDVRLSFSPERTVGLFGGDPDNFNFPRYNLDMALLRAWEDGKPAAIDDWFRFKPEGAQAGELTMILGHPGSTDRLLTVSQLEANRDYGVLSWLIHMSELRGMINQYASSSEDAARYAQADIMGIENGIKVMRNQAATLSDPRVMSLKQRQEKELRDFVAADPERQAKWGSAWDEIAQAQLRYRDILPGFAMLESGRGFYSQYFSQARRLVRGTVERDKPNGERLPEFSDSSLPRVLQALESDAPIHPDYEKVKLSWSLAKLRENLGTDHPLVVRVLGRDSPEAVAARLVDGTALGDPTVRKDLWEGGAEAVAASDDPFIVLARQVDPAARAVRQRMEDEIDAVDTRNAQRIAEARFARYGTSIYPDATFSLRLSYGAVKGWNEQGRDIEPFTVVAGVFDRATGHEPYILPERWLAARDRLDADARFNFVSTNDIIGGNSGSPVINRDAEVVGLVFDGNIHALGGAYWYDAELNRAVSVHPAVMLESLEKVYDAGHLARELRGRGD